MNEPGGISQLEAFAAGCLVVARATGGLRDTVFPLSDRSGSIEGNGFLFTDFHSGAFYDAMERAHRFFTTAGEETVAMARRNAVESVYFWDRPARKYINEIYGIKEIVRAI
jgi:starch synthase